MEHAYAVKVTCWLLFLLYFLLSHFWYWCIGVRTHFAYVGLAKVQHEYHSHMSDSLASAVILQCQGFLVAVGSCKTLVK